MTDLLLARAQMGLSLGFHIIFAAVGVSLPLFMVLAEWGHQRTGDPAYLMLAKRWAKGTAILFAIGAVSGTVLSFELGLLWPGFMRYAGGLIGMPFSLEGFAFFTEAIFLGIYLYGRDRISPRAHLFSAVVVAVSGAASAFFVVLANNWMNGPTGFRLVDGQPVDVDPIAAMFSPGWGDQVTHAILASYLATAAAVTAIHALALLRDPQSRFHRHALRIALGVLCVSAVLQPLSGHRLGQVTARRQPVKLAAMEAQFHNERPAPSRLGGIPDEDKAVTRYSIEIPGLLSLLAHDRFDAEVKGLLEFPRKDWPPVAIVHYAFQLMVGSGSALMGLSLLTGLAVLWRWRRRRRGEEPPDLLPRPLLRALVAAGPLGFLALEAGWVVTEVGRQPWIIQGVMRTRDAVTPTVGLGPRFAVFTGIYALLGTVAVVMLARHIAKARHLDLDGRDPAGDDAGGH